MHLTSLTTRNCIAPFARPATARTSDSTTVDHCIVFVLYCTYSCFCYLVHARSSVCLAPMQQHL